ncbi:hypothetical protein U1Q18_002578 [Sarracenia purpurea var. burkii]
MIRSVQSLGSRTRSGLSGNLSCNREAVSPMKSLAKEDSTRWREESTLRTEWLDPLVKDEEMDASSSPEELELGFGGCHGLLLLLQEEREPVWNSGHQLGVAEELSAHSSAMVAI